MNTKIVGGVKKSIYTESYSVVKWIPKKNISSFRALFNCIGKKLGSLGDAQVACRMSNCNRDLFYKGRLSEGEAKKIMTTYNKVCRDT